MKEVRELDKAQADGTEVILDPIDADQGLAAVHGMQEDQVDLDDEDVMDMDEIKAHLLENGIDMDVEDFLEKLLEEEIEEVVKEQEEEQGPPGGDVVKKQGLRKRLFKPTISTAGNTKMRVFNALASPRKQAAAKTGARQGDNSKQTESKESSFKNFQAGRSSMSLVLSAFLWLLLMAFPEVKQWNNKRVLRYWYFRLFMVTCICNRLDHLCGYRNMMWDNGIIGMKWNQRYSGLVVRRSRMLSSLGLKNVLVQWWQMQLGVLGFVILATVINDCPINQLDILGSMDYPLICETVWERCLSLESSNHDQIQSGWRGSNYDTREMRDDGFFSKQGDSENWCFGETSWFDVAINCDDRVVSLFMVTKKGK
ncbi:hypothetical protein HID58_003143 [Brassica napus]|uniref:Uncharacterized protein n=1 Tax=Brassica napus TaxID=3708 RepID=A0ABQ8ESE8_BRANA|nr:hypothetical protein HID58_003143 [Brassica napus]